MINEGDAYEMHNMLDVGNEEEMGNTDQRYTHSWYDYGRRCKDQQTNPIAEELERLENVLLKRAVIFDLKEDPGGIVW